MQRGQVVEMGDWRSSDKPEPALISLSSHTSLITSIQAVARLEQLGL